MIRFTVPGLPVAKQRPRKGRGGHFYTPSKTQEAEDAIGCIARMAMTDGLHDSPLEDGVSLTITFYFKGARRSDIDNLIKTVMDGLNGVCYVDDRLVERLIATVKQGEPRTEVIVEEEK